MLLHTLFSLLRLFGRLNLGGTLAGIALNMGAGSKARRIPMAKGQIRSNREKKKPKQAKEKPTGATAQFSVAQPKPVNTSSGKK